MLFKDEMFYCPLCNELYLSSDYLNTVFKDNEKSKWLANMVCHLRHNHIRYYNKWVHYHSFYGGYEPFKTKVNNRQKRNILRKCKDFLKSHNFTVNDFAELQNTDQKTLKLAVKILGGKLPSKAEIKAVTLDYFLE